MPYIAEIRMFAGNFAPAGWMFCEGQLLPISENDAMFVVIGTTYGGDGQETFALPDLRGRLPVHQGSLHQIGESGGVEQVTLSTNQIPAHSHPLLGSSAPGTNAVPTNAVPAKTTTGFLYINEAPTDTMAATSIVGVGGSQPHTNFQPYLCINYIISLYGVFPSPT